MGIDIDQAVKVGYVFSEDEIEAAFGTQFPEVAHLEDRFDPKTGQKIAPHKVIERYGYTLYNHSDVQYDDVHEFISALEKDLNADIHHYGDMMSNGGGKYVIGLGHGTRECDAKRCPEDGSFSLNEVFNDLPKLEALAATLTELGLDVGEPEIVNCYRVG